MHISTAQRLLYFGAIPLLHAPLLEASEEAQAGVPEVYAMLALMGTQAASGCMHCRGLQRLAETTVKPYTQL